MPTRLGGIAVALTDIMWRIYERRYGDEAVNRVRRMERDLTDARRLIDRYAGDLQAANEAERLARAEREEALEEANHWRREATRWRIEAKGAPTVADENPWIHPLLPEDEVKS